MQLTILAYDPGGQTGYCRATINDKACVVGPEYGQFKSDTELVPQLQSLRDIEGNKIVVYEKFVLLNNAVDPTALEVIGGIKVLSYYLKLDSFGQMPSDRTPLLKRYPELTKYKPKGAHSVTHWWDAALHAMTFAYVRCGVRAFSFAP